MKISVSKSHPSGLRKASWTCTKCHCLRTDDYYVLFIPHQGWSLVFTFPKEKLRKSSLHFASLYTLGHSNSTHSSIFNNWKLMKATCVKNIFLHRTVSENMEIPKTLMGKLLAQWSPTSAILAAKNFNYDILVYNFNKGMIQISLACSSPTNSFWTSSIPIIRKFLSSIVCLEAITKSI